MNRTRGETWTRNCFHCDKKIYLLDEKRMIPLEIPYINLWMCKDCYILLGEDGITEFILDNESKLWKVYKETK